MNSKWAYRLAPVSFFALTLVTGCTAEGADISEVDTSAEAEMATDATEEALTITRKFPGNLLETVLDTQFEDDNDIAKKGRIRVEYRGSNVDDGTLVATISGNVATVNVTIPKATIDAKAIRDRIIGGDKKRDVNIHLYQLGIVAKYDISAGVEKAKLLEANGSLDRVNAEGAGLLGERVELYIDHNDSKVRSTFRNVVVDYVKANGETLFRAALGH